MNPHLEKSGSLMALVLGISRNWKLTQSLAFREVVGRYRGSLFGLGWSFFNPLLMLAVYTFVFSVVFKTRWPGLEGDSKGAFSVVLFVGTMCHALFAECVNKAPTIVLGAANYVKRVVFPLEILPVVALLSALFHAAITLVVLLLAEFIVFGQVPWTAFLLPVVLLPLVFLTLGATWALSGLGVYIRDIAQVTSIITMVMMFLSPIFYPVSALPERFRGWLYLNPLTFIVEQSRAVLIHGQLPNFAGLAKYTLASILFGWFGFWVFQKLRRGFADVV